MSFKEWFDNGTDCGANYDSGFIFILYLACPFLLIFTPLLYYLDKKRHLENGPCDPDCRWFD